MSGLEPMEPQQEMPVNITMPENVKPSDALTDSQIKAKMQAAGPSEAEARAALERMMTGQEATTPAPTQAQPQAAPQPTAEAGQPAAAEAQPTETPLEVPQKFQTQDGKVDVPKVEKATADAEAALKLFREKEVELRRKMNEVHALKQQVQTPVNPPPQAQQNPNGLPQGITQEMVDESIKKNGPGWTLLRLAEIAKEQAKAEMEARFAEIEDREKLKDSEAQLREVGKQDPWVFTPQGINYLFELRQQYPELNNARHPMQAAYEKHLVLEVMKQRQAGQVQTPTPTPATAKAPPTPVNGARPVQAAPRININDDAAVQAHVKTLPLKEQLKFMESVLQQRGVRITR